LGGRVAGRVTVGLAAVAEVTGHDHRLVGTVEAIDLLHRSLRR
jgi:hypothetical protein